ncbi:ParB/RepB/Spo0J family partition protein [Sphingomonas glacialis]|uniref:Chromosome partitioning protein ParB n=1 Tax=Sphingomonas glacialis TaxID=658225 RepID=A0A502FFH2_9SPHN|nr:ParB N-terminal domain-containing protein [Sphingomonas glacialis]TPG48076.1 chromosome partitioning protein ParB [Sphingomonas glacialis]
MKLDFIALDKLSVSRTNMRYAKKAPDVSDILPTVRSRGVLQTLLVRPNGAPDAFEIVAGSRRFHAAQIVAEERGEAEPLPCAILDNGDDAAAIEASLIENMARLDADEVTRWATFTRLVREGRTIDEIGTTFGLPDLTIKRVLALGNLLPRIRSLYAAEKIDRGTVRHLTLASKSQQKAWLALLDDPDARAPVGHQLKAWLFGGTSIAVSRALFDVEAYPHAIVTDLFGEERYFADSEAFWSAQNAEIETRRAVYCDAGWRDVVIVPPSEQFASWDYEKAGKRKGGRIYVDVRSTGEVVFHEGYISRKDAARIAKGEGAAVAPKPARSEMTSTLQTYVDLHRHAAVRAALTDTPGVALRLMVAHAITGSPLWAVRPEPQLARNDAVTESVENARGEADFDARRRPVLGLLGFSPEEPHVVGGYGDPSGPAGLFLRLLDLPDTAVLDVVAIVMGESLAAGSAAVEAVGLHLGVRMEHYWQADAALLDLIRDRDVLLGMVAEVAGPMVADANAGEKGKTLRRIIADHLGGVDGRAKREHWVPRWMTFPPSAYTARGGVGTVAAHAKVIAALDALEPGPVAPEDEASGAEPDNDEQPQAVAA